MTALDFTLIGLASWRWARLVTHDEITHPAREAVDEWAQRSRRRHYSSTGTQDDWRGKVAYLSGCPHCVGVWAAAALTWVYVAGPSWLWWPAVYAPAAAAVVSALALLLPED